MANNPRIKIAKGYAIVSPLGRIQVETTGRTKLHCEQFMTEWDTAKGNKIMRVSVVVELKR